MKMRTVQAILCVLAAMHGAIGEEDEASQGRKGEVVLGDIRVQCLSETLVRVEPKGQWGFEDRNTFVVQNRELPGVDVTLKEEDGNKKLVTDYYTVVLPGEGSSFTIYNTNGDQVYNSEEDTRENKNHMQWPAPYTASAYAIVDHPRFAVPEWGASPCCPPDVDVPEHLKATNGYDFGNDVEGDTYVFLLGAGLEGWNAARTDYGKLAGPVPLLPDYAFGNWFTWWHPYTEEEAKGEIQKWEDDKIPIDVWGLDMNWRLATDGQDTTYDHPNTSAFPDYGKWFQYIKDKGIHTYFNDHPMPKSPQTSGDEIGFRWNGLTSWLEQGLTFWWFDHNWLFSIPPPNLDSSEKESSWEGLSNTAWGSHVFFTITERFNLINRQDDKEWWGGRTIALTKFAMPDWEAGRPPSDHAEMAGHHRYPVWWTGDDVTLQASVESMVDCGVHDFKPYVHSDCGGFGWFTHGDLMRWTAHCTFGTIYRNHGANHQPWIYGDYWESEIAKYIRLRYKMSPSLIAGGQRATLTGFPLVARCDLYWPEQGEPARSNQQYIFLDDVLVAPIWDSDENMSKREVWIPPGDWQDVWNGWIISGGDVGMTMEVEQPWRRQPMWHRRDGGLMVLTDEDEDDIGLRIAKQDWSSLTLDAFPSYGAMTTKRTVYERSTEPNPPTTEISMSTDGAGTVKFEIGDSPAERAWLIRLNLHPNQKVKSVKVDDKELSSEDIKETAPRAWDDGSDWYGFFPFGKNVAGHAGNRVDVRLPASATKRTVEVKIEEVEAKPAGTEDAAEGSDDDAAEDAVEDDSAANGDDGTLVEEAEDKYSISAKRPLPLASSFAGSVTPGAIGLFGFILVVAGLGMGLRRTPLAASGHALLREVVAEEEEEAPTCA